MKSADEWQFPVQTESSTVICNLFVTFTPSDAFLCEVATFFGQVLSFRFLL